jgi:hypothetical protein
MSNPACEPRHGTPVHARYAVAASGVFDYPKAGARFRFGFFSGLRNEIIMAGKLRACLYSSHFVW